MRLAAARGGKLPQSLALAALLLLALPACVEATGRRAGDDGVRCKAGEHAKARGSKGVTTAKKKPPTSKSGQKGKAQPPVLEPLRPECPTPAQRVMPGTF